MPFARRQEPSVFRPRTKEGLKTAVDEYVRSARTRARALSQYGDISTWDTSQITDMSDLFNAYLNSFVNDEMEAFNLNIENWNVSNVTNMNSMFAGCRLFNQPLNNWNVSNVTNMKMMFHGCARFNQPLNDWNVAKVTNMDGMFMACTRLNQLFRWNVPRLTTAFGMFNGCSALPRENIQFVFSNGRTATSVRMFPTPDDEIPPEENEDEDNNEFETQEPENNMHQAEELYVETAEERNARAAAIQDSLARHTATLPQAEPSSYQECTICGDLLNNIDGPTPADTQNKCTSKCKDVVEVHPNDPAGPHRFHRGCIIGWCRAGRVNVTSQMGMNTQIGHEVNQSRTTQCPICTKPLGITCSRLQSVAKVPVSRLSISTQHGGAHCRKRLFISTRIRRCHSCRCRCKSKHARTRTRTRTRRHVHRRHREHNKSRRNS